MRHKFLAVSRRSPAELNPNERLAHFGEYYARFEDETAAEQAERCMDCGTPFCHVGEMIGPEVIGCPIQNLIPEWNKLVTRGQWREAYERLRTTNNFPEFTGRVCPAPCEGSCTLGLIGDAVTIKSIERTIIDRAFEEGWVVPRPPKTRSGRRIAVVGSGPAGLAAADQLNQKGHIVTVIEKSDAIGGLLYYGIPNMKLDKAVVERRVELLRAEGIIFLTNIEVGVTVTMEQLREEYDAVIVCTGAQVQRRLGIDGEEAAGVELAMDYLTATQRALDTGEAVPPEFDANGKRVIVIGGGDTGADCVAVALRQGAQSVRQFGKYAERPSVREADRPWPLQPQLHLADYAYAEAAARHGRDPREYLIRSNRLVVEGGRVTGIETERTYVLELPDGQKQALPVEDGKTVMAADLVLVAIGFTSPETALSKQGIVRTRGYETTFPSVFVAGDARRGQSLIVWAIREGREAAEAVHTYLKACQLV